MSDRIPVEFQLIKSHEHLHCLPLIRQISSRMRINVLTSIPNACSFVFVYLTNAIVRMSLARICALGRLYMQLYLA
jgi:hypothetical protein